MTSLYNPTSVNATQKTLGAALLTGATASVTLNSVTNIVNGLGAFVVDRVDANGTSTASKREYITFTGVSGSTLTGLTRSADGGGSDQDHAVGAIVEFVSDVVQAKAVKDVIETDHSTAGDHELTAFDNVNAPRGFLLNGKIVPSVASDDLTVAIKGLDGEDPSATNPVYCRIGDTIRSITAALSVTKVDATNWFDSGGSELATKEIDYFVYLGYNATDGVVVGFSRVASGREYDSFHATTTNEKYCAISTITNAAAGDDYELIGRFAATLSAGAGYTWTVPAFTNKNLIQRPIYETRWLDYIPTITFTAGTDPSNPNANYTLSVYKLIGDTCHLQNFRLYGSAGATVTETFFTLPFNQYALTTSTFTCVASRVVPLADHQASFFANKTSVASASISMTQAGMTGGYKY